MTLYHYCSTEVFYSIVSNKEIRLSSLSLSNDSMEGKILNNALSEVAKKGGLDSKHIEKLQVNMSFVNDQIDGLGFCLSEEGDILSQWRGYANDATGFSIGFSKKYLKQYPENSAIPELSIGKVIYDQLEQEKIVLPTYERVKSFIDQGAFKPYKIKTILTMHNDEDIEIANNETDKLNQSLFLSLTSIISDFFLLKSSAFKEELEWRLISIILKNVDEECLYQVCQDSIKHYKSLKLEASDISPIEEIVIGPKNRTPKYVVESFLKQNGFNDVKVRFSDASYR